MNEGDTLATFHLQQVLTTPAAWHSDKARLHPWEVLQTTVNHANITTGIFSNKNH